MCNDRPLACSWRENIQCKSVLGARWARVKSLLVAFLNKRERGRLERNSWGGNAFLVEVHKKESKATVILEPFVKSARKRVDF